MITLDQVKLLEQKVERAVEKIHQLQAENDALCNKCSELTNALSAKSEQLISFEQDQSQIESGIKKALDRLDSIENSVLKATGQPQPTVKVETTATVTPVAQPVQSTQQENPSSQANSVLPQQPYTQAHIQESPATSVPSFDQMEDILSDEEIDESADENQDLGFDIF